MDLILLWHFHQPYYGSPGAAHFELPWVRLHAAKSYLDMAEVVRANPAVRVTANFSGSLLEQIRRYVDDGWRDTFWDLTRRPAEQLSKQEVQFLLSHFFSLNWKRVFDRHPRYEELLERRGRGADPDDWLRPSDQEMTDLQVLFNLAWCGFTLRRDDERVRALIAKGGQFDQADKETILQVHLDALERVLPAWRQLADAGQAEICVSPHYHPILPLLIDSDSASRALPDSPMPSRFCYSEDAAAQIQLALDTAEQAFERRPTGIWPSEGSVSPELIPLVADAGLSWLASDEEVLLESERTGQQGRDDTYQPWLADDRRTTMFFRDHELSDLIGFNYAEMVAETAVTDFVGRLETLAERLPDDDQPCVNVILDGENAWEHFPNDGQQFLESLYASLAASPDIQMTTPSRRLAEREADKRILRLHSGSWIYANFKIWIGACETNLAWEYLQQARRVFETAAEQSPELDRALVNEARTYLFRAEGSDWMWWYGDDFSSANDAEFDALFRGNLAAVYEAIGLSAPASLHVPIDCEDSLGDRDGTRDMSAGASTSTMARASRSVEATNNHDNSE